MTERDIDVVVAGHICLDTTPTFDPAAGASVEDMLQPGKLTVVGPPTISAGGPVSNTGLSMRRLGLNVSLMGKCGDDPLGELLVQVVRKEAPGAEAGMRVTPGEQTSYSIVLAPPGVDRMFLHCPGANDTFGPEDVDLEIVGRARLFHFGYPPLMARMYSGGGRELARVLSDAAEAGACTSLDLALPDPVSPAGRADWNEILSAALPHADLFLPSLEELMFVLDRNRSDELSAAPGGVIEAATIEDLRALAGRCLDMGARIVVIKCGQYGAYLKTGREAGRLDALLGTPDEWRDVEMFEPACKVDEIKSATGSGDSAIAGFLCALLQGEQPPWCMAVLTAVGAQNLSDFGSVGGIRSWQETLVQVQSDPLKVDVPDRLKVR